MLSVGFYGRAGRTNAKHNYSAPPAAGAALWSARNNFRAWLETKFPKSHANCRWLLATGNFFQFRIVRELRNETGPALGRKLEVLYRISRLRTTKWSGRLRRVDSKGIVRDLWGCVSALCLQMSRTHAGKRCCARDPSFQKMDLWPESVKELHRRYISWIDEM